jgi:hypothetical protein
MEGLDDALDRLRADENFRSRLAEDPTAALAGYDLSTEDLWVLVKHLDPDGHPPAAGFAELFSASTDAEEGDP